MLEGECWRHKHLGVAHSSAFLPTILYVLVFIVLFIIMSLLITAWRPFILSFCSHPTETHYLLFVAVYIYSS